jgi:class 3 adenylate cyclase
MLDPQSEILGTFERTSQRSVPSPPRVGADPASVLLALAACSHAAEVGEVLVGFAEDLLAAQGCSAEVRVGPYLECAPCRGDDGEDACLDRREMLVPLRRGERSLGVLRIGGITRVSLEHRRWLTIAAHAAAAELERLRIEAVARHEHQHVEQLSRYVPGPISDRIQADRGQDSGERDITVLFLDVRGYTTTASMLRCSQVFRLLNRYVRSASSIIRRHGGTIVEFNGDGMMAVFGAPDPLEAKEGAAARAALKLALAVPPLVRRLESELPDTPSIGVGVASGRGYVGDIAAEDRLIWSAVGSTTNLASRLQTLTRELRVPIALDEATWSASGDAARHFARRDGVSVRGLADPLTLYVASEIEANSIPRLG